MAPACFDLTDGLTPINATGIYPKHQKMRKYYAGITKCLTAAAQKVPAIVELSGQPSPRLPGNFVNQFMPLPGPVLPHLKLSKTQLPTKDEMKVNEIRGWR